VVGPQFSDLFWPVACVLWDFFFFKAAGGTRVQAVISTFYFMLILFFNNVLNFCGDGSHNKGTGFFALQLRRYLQTPSQTL
jgi:hypothetical protein